MHLEVKPDDVVHVNDVEIGDLAIVSMGSAMESRQESLDSSSTVPSTKMADQLLKVSDSETLSKNFAFESNCQLDVILSGSIKNSVVETNLAYYADLKVNHSAKLPNQLETRMEKLAKASSSFGSISTFTAREKIKAIVEMMESIHAST